MSKPSSSLSPAPLTKYLWSCFTERRGPHRHQSQSSVASLAASQRVSSNRARSSPGPGLVLGAARLLATTCQSGRITQYSVLGEVHCPLPMGRVASISTPRGMRAWYLCPPWLYHQSTPTLEVLKTQLAIRHQGENFALRYKIEGHQRHYFANEGPSGQGYGFSSGHVWM